MTKKQIRSRSRDLQVFERDQLKQIPSEQSVPPGEPYGVSQPWEPGVPYVESTPDDNEVVGWRANPRLTAGGLSGSSHRPLEGGRY